MGLPEAGIKREAEVEEESRAHVRPRLQGLDQFITFGEIRPGGGGAENAFIPKPWINFSLDEDGRDRVSGREWDFSIMENQEKMCRRLRQTGPHVR